MKTAATVAHMLIRILGLVAIALGILFWTGNARNLVPIHMLVGLLLVLSLWTLALLAARAGVSWGVVALALVWGLIVPILGMTQAALLPGQWHWVIQVLHLLVGMGAVGQGEGLAARMRGRLAAVPASS
jgi:hypothetical protein